MVFRLWAKIYIVDNIAGNPLNRIRLLRGLDKRLQHRFRYRAGIAALKDSVLFDAAYYLEKNPDVAQSGVEPLPHYLRHGAIEGRNPHPLFDTNWYMARNPDVAAAGLNPLAHYVMHGWRERRDPHPFFSIAFYFSEYPDVEESGREPLEHYWVSGAAEKRNPHPIFDAHFYFEQHPELARSGMNPLAHLLNGGGNPNRYFDTAFYLNEHPELPPLPSAAMQHYLSRGAEQGDNPHPLFDTRWYLEQNPEVVESGENPLLHFLRIGRRQGRDPHPLFDSKFYVERNADILPADVSPSDHYLYSGGMEARDPHPLFDSDWYLAQTPEAEGNPLVHYIRVGWKNKRSPSAVFDEAFYLERNPDVARGNISSLQHYLLYGAAQGRNPNPWFDTRWYASEYPEIVAAGWNPLVHYVLLGAREGRRTRAAAERVEQATMRRRSRLRIVFVSGEPQTPGHRYRVLNMARSLAPRFFETAIISASEASQRVGEIADADLIWIWRARLSPELAQPIRAGREAGIPFVFDVDDLMFRPELATIERIDGIRTQNMTESEVRRFYIDVALLVKEADRCTAPTLSLAQEIRELGKPATVIPNGFDASALEGARAAIQRRESGPHDGFIRIGYAAGSFTHQKDFAAASQALAAILGGDPRVRLVLFRDAIRLDEFPELNSFAGQIEWRDRVPLEELLSEYARFDINIAPLELGNPYTESKSELKFFEAALVEVPTIASPTRPFADAIRDGENGLLARDSDEWYRQLQRLVSDAGLRSCLAKQAHLEVLWWYGPERRNLLVTRFIQEMLAARPLRFDLFRGGMHSEALDAIPPAAVPEYEVLFQSAGLGTSRVSVIMPLYNYAHYVEEALDSVLRQTLRDIDVIVVDDRSTDNSVEVAARWLEQHAGRFNKIGLLRNRCNGKLARARNAGISFSDTEFYMALDADNALLPDCLELCMRQLDETGAAFAYPTISLFGQMQGELGAREYDPAHFQCGNYIDAMAMVRKACWIAVGGYTPLEPMGWEDYEFWCKLAEKGLFGVRVPETTAKYRMHGTSMLRTVTDLAESKQRVIEEMNRRHPWLQLRVSAS